MDNIILTRPAPQTAAEYEAALAEMFAEMDRLDQQREKDRAEIERLRTETEAIQARTQRLKAESRAMPTRLAVAL